MRVVFEALATSMRHSNCLHKIDSIGMRLLATPGMIIWADVSFLSGRRGRCHRRAVDAAVRNAGHRVAGTTRSAEKAEALRARGGPIRSWSMFSMQRHCRSCGRMMAPAVLPASVPISLEPVQGVPGEIDRCRARADQARQKCFASWRSTSARVKPMSASSRSSKRASWRLPQSRSRQSPRRWNGARRAAAMRFGAAFRRARRLHVRRVHNADGAIVDGRGHLDLPCVVGSVIQRRQALRSARPPARRCRRR